MTEKFDSILRLIDKAKTADALVDRYLVHDLCLLAADDELDHELASEIEGRLDWRIAQQQLLGDSFDPAPTLFPGELEVGTAKHAAFRLPLSTLNGHVMGVCPSGGGKSNWIKFMVPGLATRIKSVWVFTIKTDFRQLVRRCRLDGQAMHLATQDRVAINPLEVPPGVDPRRWTNVAASIICQALNITDIGAGLIRYAVMLLYHRRQILSGGDKFPNMVDLASAVEQQSAHKQVMLAVTSRIHEYLAGSQPQSYTFTKGLPVAQLAEMSVVFELGDYGPASKMIMLTLIASLYEWRRAQNRSNRKLETFIFIDDAHGVIDERTITPYTRHMFQMIRETGTGLGCFTQTSHSVDRIVLSNTAVRILGWAETFDYEHFGRGSLGLNPAQVDYCRSWLQPGRFVARVRGIPQPFLFTVPLVEQSQQIKDQEATELGRDIALLPVAKANDLTDLDIFGLGVSINTSPLASTDRTVNGPDKTSDGGESSSGSVIDKEERSYLLTIREHPDLSVTQYHELLPFGTTKCVQLRQQLVKQDLVREHVIETGRRGGRTIRLELTDRAIKALSATESS